MTERRFGQALALTQVAAIAVNTFKEAVRSRVFYILLAFAVCLLVFSSAMGLMAVGSLSRVILDMGLSTMTLFSAMTAIFVGIGLVYQEIERKTIYNILSKPVSRTHFLIGRYCGLMAVLLTNLLVMVLALSLVLAAAGGFTGRILAAAGYTFLELMILTAVAIFFSSLTSPVVSALCTVGFFIIWRRVRASFNSSACAMRAPAPGRSHAKPHRHDGCTGCATSPVSVTNRQ